MWSKKIKGNATRKLTDKKNCEKAKEIHTSKGESQRNRRNYSGMQRRKKVSYHFFQNITMYKNLTYFCYCHRNKKCSLDQVVAYQIQLQRAMQKKTVYTNEKQTSQLDKRR